MSRRNNKSGQKTRGRATRDLPVRNTKHDTDAKGGHSSGVQVLLGDGSVRTLSSGGVLVGMGDGSVRTVGS